MLKYLFSILFIIVILAVKPITAYFIQTYTSSLLHKKVEITSLNLTQLKADGYIEKIDNKITISIIKLFPLEAIANYDGNIDAFSIYHPLKGSIKADANITYDDKLTVNADALLYESKIKVQVKQLKNNWYVSVNTKELDLDIAKKQNNQNFDIDAKVSLEYKLITDKNSSLNISTNNLIVSNKSFNNVDIKLKLLKNKFTIDSSFKPKSFYKTMLHADGSFKDNYITASTNIKLDDMNIDIDKLKINTKNLETNLHSSSFGGDLNIAFKNNFLYFKAKSLQIQKILKKLKQNEFANGNINLKGKLNTKNLTANFIIDSKQTTIAKQKFKDITMSISKLNYKDKKLTASYKIDATLLAQPINLIGNVDYFKNTFKLTAKSNNYGGETIFYLENDKYKLYTKNLDIEKLLKSIKQKPYASGTVDINANGNFNKINFNILSKAKIYKKDIQLKMKGLYDIKSKLLTSNFQTSLKLKEENINIDAKTTFKDHLVIKANNHSFDSNTTLKLNDQYFELLVQNLNLEKLTSSLDNKKPLYGYVNLQVKGTLQNMEFKVTSSHVKNSMQLDEIDNYIALNLYGTYKKKYLNIKNNLILHYKKELIPITMDATVNLVPPYKSKVSFSSNQDRVIIKSFSYENKQVKSDFLIDIKELYKYRILTSPDLYGALLIKGYYTDALYVKTNSFGGELKASLNKDDAKVKFDNLNVKKVFALIKKEDLFDFGDINGNIDYNIKTKNGMTDISVLNTKLNGLNLDKQLSSLDDILGLNVINISKSFVSKLKNDNHDSTYIKHLELDLSLKNKNIYLDDVAMSTKRFRFVALGSLKQNGDINQLGLNIIDKKGCAILTQNLKGNIENPKISTTTTAISLVEKVPSSIFKTGKEIIDFSGKAVDKITSFGVHKIFRTDRNISIVSNTISRSSSILDSGEKIILRKCKVIYDNKVKHPEGD